jgi:hypothetical protein
MQNTLTLANEILQGEFHGSETSNKLFGTGIDNEYSIETITNETQ